jgi:putative transposase
VLAVAPNWLVPQQAHTELAAQATEQVALRAKLFAENRPLPEILEDVARLGAQLLMQAALEAEVTEFLRWDRYQRAASTEDARPGSRNGYRR